MASTNFSPGTVITSTWLNDVNTAVYTTIPGLAASITASITKTSLGLGNVDNTSDVNKPVSTATQTALNTKQDASAKDTSGGYAGLTGYNINFKNTAGTFVSQFTNATTASRTYTFPDKSGTVAMTSDIPVVNNSLVLISTTTIPGGVAASFFLNAFSSTYDNYIVELNGITVASADLIAFRMAVGGAVDSSTSYVQMMADGGSAGANNTTYLSPRNSSNSTSILTATLEFMNMNTTGTGKIMSARGMSYNPTGTPSWSSFSNRGQYSSTSAVTGFMMYTLGGANLTGGTIRIFGVKNN